MTIKSFNITSVEGRRMGDVRPPKNLHISHDINVSFPDLREEGLKAEFRVIITYSGLGTITIAGEILVGGKDEEIKKLYEEWKEKGNLPPTPITQEIYNGVLGGVMPHAFYLSKELKLPPPIPLPAVNIVKKKGKKRSEGVEVA